MSLCWWRNRKPSWSVFGYKPDATGRPSNENKPTCKLCHMEVAVKGGNTTNLFFSFKAQASKGIFRT